MNHERPRPKPPRPAQASSPSFSRSAPNEAVEAVDAQVPQSGAPTQFRPSSVDEAEAAPAPSFTARADPFVGKTIDGRYLIEAVLGEGGMGVVYRGRHKVIDKRVAIKILRGDMAKDQEITQRFLQEARAASSIGNPHIIDISDFGQTPDGATYFVMEFLEGKSLTDVMTKERPLSVGRICQIGRQIAEGLAAAHAANIIHRDLKPDNVMLVRRGTDTDFVKVLDFGIAKVGGASNTKMTRAGSVFGTPHYMSPEQAAGATVDLRTDVYSLGVMLYEMASGKVPFDADNFMGILTQHMYRAPVPMRALVPAVDVPPGLDAVVLKCLTKKAEGRYESMGELVADLERVERGVLPAAVNEMMARSGGFNVPADYFRSAGMPAPVPATPAGLPRRSRLPLYAAIAAVGTILGVAGAVLVARSGTTTAQPRAGTGSVAPPVIAPAGSAGAAAPVSAAPKVTRPVILSSTPDQATVKRGDTDLGATSVVLLLADDEVATVTVSKDGYRSETVEVRAADAKKMVTLKALAAAPTKATVPPPATTAAPKPVVTATRPAITDDNPWAKPK